MVKAGWRTTEFWIAIVAQGLALLALIGWITPADKAQLEQALSAAVVAVFTIVANAIVVARYIQGRLDLKSQAMEKEETDVLPPDDSPRGGGYSIAGFLIAAVAVGLLGGSVQAQQPKPAAKLTPCCCCEDRPCVPGCQPEACPCPCCKVGQPAAFLPWRERIEKQLQQQRQPQTDPAIAQALSQIAATQQQILMLLARDQRGPAPGPQIIILGVPRQELPIEGKPKQELPIEGRPKQELPIEGKPKQELPPQGQPKQELPPGGLPKQELLPAPRPGPAPLPPMPQAPDSGTPQQQLPAGPPQGYQKFTPALWRPAVVQQR